MKKELKINLNSKLEIKKEGAQKKYKPRDGSLLPISRKKNEIDILQI